MKILYANGDSWTAGAEIPNEYPIGCTSTRYYNTWPWFLSRNLDIPMVINQGEGAGSNSRIFRKTNDFIFRYIGSGKNPKDLMIVIGWTTSERTEIPLDDHYAKVTLHHVLTLGDSKSLEKELNDAAKKFYANTNLSFFQIQQLRYMLNLRLLCKNLGITYYDFIALGPRPKDLKELSKKTFMMDLENIFHTTWNEYCYVCNCQRYPDKHPTIETHEIWANELSEFIKT